MSVATKGHRWGVVAQDGGRDYAFCPLCGRYSDGERYIRKRDIPRSALVVDSQRPFWEGEC